MLIATLRGARGSRVRLLHGLTGTKAVRRRRARTPIFIPSGWPDRAMNDCCTSRFRGCAFKGSGERYGQWPPRWASAALKVRPVPMVSLPTEAGRDKRPPAVPAANVAEEIRFEHGHMALTAIAG